MAEMLLTRTLSGMLAPENDDDAESIRKYKVGSTIRCTTSQMRNWAFHKKWFALAKVAYGMWADELPELEYGGVLVRPEFDRFRRDLIIMAGYFRPVYAINGTMRLEAESMSWSDMGSDRFEAMYSATVNVILSKILKHKKLTEKQLRDTVESIMRFT